MAAALRFGYPDIFKRNEYAYKLDKGKLTDLIVEMTGLERGNGVVKNIVGTFSALNEFADFENFDDHSRSDVVDRKPESVVLSEQRGGSSFQPADTNAQSIGMNLSYTINLNLPETTDVEVFNSIFRALKENLLR
jgi:hypothetical protein